MEYKPWFERDPGGFAAERAEIEARGFVLNHDAFVREKRIQFDGQSKIDPNRELFLCLPDTFPSCAPKMFDSQKSNALIRHHNQTTRQFCLFGFNEHRWNATMHAVAAIDEVEELIDRYDGSKPLPTDESVPEPITRQLVFNRATSLLIPPPFCNIAPQDLTTAGSGNFVIRWKGEERKNSDVKYPQAVLTEMQIGTNSVRCGDFYLNLTNNSRRSGRWYFLDGEPTVVVLNQFLEKLARGYIEKRENHEHWVIVLFYEHSSNIREKRLAWILCRLRTEQGSKSGPAYFLTFVANDNGANARVPGLSGLMTKRVLILGCGSVGSKVAVGLAAAGICNFFLVDYDYFEPDNLVRHELGVEDFGLDKSVALLKRLRSINPQLSDESQSFAFQVGGSELSQTTHARKLYELVSKTDLVVDACGLRSVTHFLNDLCSEIQKPLIVATITNGAWGGEVVRSVPTKTACWRCWADHFYENGPPSAPREQGLVFPPGCDQPTFTGAGHELEMFASLVTALAIDTVLSKGEFNGDYIRWSNRDTDGKPLLKTEILPFQPRDQCPWCKRV